MIPGVLRNLGTWLRLNRPSGAVGKGLAQPLEMVSGVKCVLYPLAKWRPGELLLVPGLEEGDCKAVIIHPNGPLLHADKFGGILYFT